MTRKDIPKRQRLFEEYLRAQKDRDFTKEKVGQYCSKVKCILARIIAYSPEAFSNVSHDDLFLYDPDEFIKIHKQIQLYLEKVKLEDSIFYKKIETYKWPLRFYYNFIKSNEDFYSPDEIPQEYVGSLNEGAIRKITVNAYERNSAARRACIEKFGCRCYCCTFDFGEEYGEELGTGFIHVHHVIPLSEIGKEYQVDPLEDLKPVCPNCHAMLHRKKDDNISVEDLKELLAVRRAGKK